jgi:hypothetical protein
MIKDAPAHRVQDLIFDDAFPAVQMRFSAPESGSLLIIRGHAAIIVTLPRKLRQKDPVCLTRSRTLC